MTEVCFAFLFIVSCIMFFVTELQSIFFHNKSTRQKYSQLFIGYYLLHNVYLKKNSKHDL